MHELEYILEYLLRVTCETVTHYTPIPKNKQYDLTFVFKEIILSKGKENQKVNHKKYASLRQKKL